MREEPGLIGTMLGSYRILGELSRGGMGEVYRAEHAVLERIVAVKLLHPELTANDELVTRFINEARAASAIRHPGIVEVLDFGHADDGRAYCVMEMLQGETLAQRIAQRGRLSEQEAAQITRGIAAALSAAHAKGIVHRDLKPDNVFLIPDPDLGERPKVLDFGIAKLGERAPGDIKYTQTGALIGTPLYMAPEQARAASHIDHRADLYSLGCMLYEMLVGEPPFVATGAGEIIALQMFGSAQRPSERVPGLSPALDHIVVRLLEKEPQDRFQNAAELADALGVELGEVTARMPAATGPAKPALYIPTHLDGPPTHLLGAPRSRGMTAALVVLGVVAAAAIAFVVLRKDGPKATAPAAAPVVDVQRAPAPAPTEPVAQPAPPVAQPAPVPPTPDPTPVTNPVTQPTQNKAQRTQKTIGHPGKRTKGGSPYEDDID
jgi:serine/threonine-protein kinase